MQRTFVAICFFLCLTGLLGVVYAQSSQSSIFDALGKQPRQGEGVVVIHQSDAIKTLVGTRVDNENIDTAGGKSTIKTMGYRIQVYSGNNQRTSKAEVYDLEKKLKEMYKNIETYIDYDAPFWKLLVGNFVTYEEAFATMRELRKSFPQRKNEINIMETMIQLSIN